MLQFCCSKRSLFLYPPAWLWSSVGAGARVGGGKCSVAAALEKAFDSQLASTVRAEHLVWFSTSLQQTFGCDWLPALFAQRFLSLPIFIGAQRSLQLLSEKTATRIFIGISPFVFHNFQWFASNRLLTCRCWNYENISSRVFKLMKINCVFKCK